MPKIEEKRRQLEAKLHEMAEDGVMKRPSVATASYDPIEEKEEHVAQKQGNFIPEEVVCPKEEALTMDAYRSTYFAPLRIREKTSFTMNAETLEQATDLSTIDIPKAPGPVDGFRGTAKTPAKPTKVADFSEITGLK